LARRRSNVDARGRNGLKRERGRKRPLLRNGHSVRPRLPASVWVSPSGAMAASCLDAIADAAS
jgi:hypothetical protein